MQAIHVAVFVALLTVSTGIPAACSTCTAQADEHDLQEEEELSLIQKRATSHQSHVQGQERAASAAAGLRQPAEEAVGEEPREKPAEEPGEEPPEESGEGPREEPVEEAPKESGEEPGKEPGEEPAEEASGEDKEKKGKRKEAKNAQAKENREAGETRRPETTWRRSQILGTKSVRPFVIRIRNGCKLAQGITILGCMSFIMSIFYLVNSTSQVVRRTAWDIVAGTASILVAVLLYNTVNKCINLATGREFEGAEGEEEKHHDGSIEDIEVFGGMLLMWWCIVNAGLYACKSSLLHLRAFGDIGGHILGFAYINVFGTIAILPMCQKSHWMQLFVSIAFLTVFPVIHEIKVTLMKMFVSRAGVSEKISKQWHEQSCETLTDSFVMCGSFMLSLWIRFVISGYPAPLGTQRRKHSVDEMMNMCMVCVACFILAAVLTKFAGEFADVTSHMIAMTGAWVLLFLVHWLIYVDFKNTFVGDTIVALTSSMLGCIFILIAFVLRRGLEFRRRSLRGALVGMAIAVGLSWEHVFDNSLESFEYNGVQAEHIIVAHVVLIILIAPAWMLYMLPNSDLELAEKLSGYLKTGNLPLSAIWSADDFYNPDDMVQEKAEDS
mmetsp:Transcript_98072/g.169973  ORF Transcript_98072/g.169973 Transcript_98072/m.169973 type:complete len:610 (-) Transcript_98072:139-1968(-)